MDRSVATCPQGATGGEHQKLDGRRLLVLRTGDTITGINRNGLTVAIPGRRSVELLALDGNEWRPAGNVTIPPNHEVPAPGTVVEVKYLYAYKTSGSVYQPVYLGPRDDIPASDCTRDQLKFKDEVLELATA